jgi:hypothetical protein
LAFGIDHPFFAGGVGEHGKGAIDIHAVHQNRGFNNEAGTGQRGGQRKASRHCPWIEFWSQKARPDVRAIAATKEAPLLPEVAVTLHLEGAAQIGQRSIQRREILGPRMEGRVEIRCKARVLGGCPQPPVRHPAFEARSSPFIEIIWFFDAEEARQTLVRLVSDHRVGNPR